jgi:hypothetical protein
MERRAVTDETLEMVVKILIQRLGERIEKHGRGAFTSGHEALGVLEEERWELVEALKSNDPNRTAEEWFDCAVTCVFAVSSMVRGVKPECSCGDAGACSDCDKSEPVEIEPQYTKPDTAADVARKQMMEAAERAGIIITDTI